MVKAELPNRQNQAHSLAYHGPDRSQEEGPLVFRRDNMVLQYATAEAETAQEWWCTMLQKPATTWASCDISSDATGHYQIIQGAEDWFTAVETMPAISGCAGRKRVPKADCNLAFICIFKLVRLWTVAKQWQGIFIIISLVGWGGKGGREWPCLTISLEGRTPFSISGHQTWWFPGPHCPCGPWQLLQNLSCPPLLGQVCICPPLLGLTPPSPLPSLSSLTRFPSVGWMPLRSLLFSFFMAEFFSIFYKYSVCVNSMICLLKITDIDRALHSLQTTFSSIISNESPTILWEGVNQGSNYGHIFYRQENWGLGRRSSDLPNVT